MFRYKLYFQSLPSGQLRLPLRPDCKEERRDRDAKRGDRVDPREEIHSTCRTIPGGGVDSLLRDLTGTNVSERIRDEDWDNTAGRGETAV